MRATVLDPPSRTTTFWGGVLDPPLPNYYLLGGGRGVSLEGRPPLQAKCRFPWQLWQLWQLWPHPVITTP